MAARRRLALLLAACCLLRSVSACSDVMGDPSKFSGHSVSGRNLDWYPLSTQPLHLVSVPAGTHLDWLPLGECRQAAALRKPAAAPPQLASVSKAKWGFLCFTVAHTNFADGLRKACPSLSLANWPGVCYDGMNSAGLSVAVNVHSSAPRPPVGVKPNGKLQVAWTDVTQLFLANFKTVAEVAKAITPGNTDIVSSALLDEAAAATLPNIGLPMVHWILHDATGATAVLEAHKTRDGGFGWALLDNPQGVTTNAPSLPEQLAYARDWQAAQVKQHGAATAAGMLPGHCTGPALNGINQPAGPFCDSIWRFTTLAVLKNATYGHFPNPAFALNPRADPDPAHAAASAVMGLLNRVTVPGAWPSSRSTTYGSDESTIVQFLRDHKSATYTARTYGNLGWTRLSVPGVLAAPAGRSSGRIAVAPLEAVMPVAAAWTADGAPRFAAAAA